MLGMGGHGIPDNITVSTVTAGSFTVTSSTIPTNGLYLPAANTVGIATNGTLRVSVSTTAVTVAAGMDVALSEGKLTVTNTAAGENALQIVSSATTVQAFVVNAPSLTEGYGLYLGDFDALTIGGCLYAFSNSADTSARSLINSINDNTAATGAYCLRMQQDAANAFMNLVGTAAGTTTDPISTLTTPGATYGFAQVDVNGAKKWVQLFADPS